MKKNRLKTIPGPRGSGWTDLSILFSLLPCFCSECPAWRKAPPCDTPRFLRYLPLLLFLLFFSVLSLLLQANHPLLHIPSAALQSSPLESRQRSSKKNHNPQKAQLLGWGGGVYSYIFTLYKLKVSMMGQIILKALFIFNIYYLIFMFLMVNILTLKL